VVVGNPTKKERPTSSAAPWFAEGRSAVRLSRGSRSAPGGRGPLLALGLQTPVRVARPRFRITPGREVYGHIGLAGRAGFPIGATSFTGCRRRPRSSPWRAAAASFAAACASASGPRPTRCLAAAGHHEPHRRRRPGRGSRRAATRRTGCASARHSYRPGRVASHEVSLPLQRSLAVPRCPVLPTSGRSRCGVGARPATRSRRRASRWSRTDRDPWRRGPSPLRFSACARRLGRESPAAADRAPARTGHAPPLLHGRCSATRASHRTAWPMPPRGGTGGAPGVRPFAAFLPPAGVAAFPPLGPTCRFPGA
jgi:hypothetical protein